MAHSTPARRDKVPQGFLRAIVAMCLATLVFATYARVTGMEPAATPPDDRVAIVTERHVVITSKLDASAMIWSADGALIADLGPDEAGFIAGVHRSLVRQRNLAGVEGNPPVRIVHYADGRLGLRDPLTDFRVELIGFGHTNRDSFARLFAN